MKLNYTIAIFILIILYLILSNSILTPYESIAICFSFFYFYWFIDNIGKRILIVEVIGLGACLTWLCMPVVFYHNFDALAELWQRKMAVESDEYFSYVLWGTVFLIIGLHFPFKSQKNIPPTKVYFQLIKANNKKYLKISNIILGISLFAILTKRIVPDELAQVFEILENFIFVSAFYSFFAESITRTRNIIITISVIIIISASSGMFGKLTFISTLSYLIISSSFSGKISFLRKMIVIMVAVLSLSVLQSVKHDFRKQTWGIFGEKSYEGNTTLLFFEMFFDKTQNFESILSEEALFGLTARLNQGYLISLPMSYIPRYKDYVGAEPIVASIIGGFIPRIVWPDKPTAGGKANMLRYAGVTIDRVSMNVSPIGELYGSFGKIGGIIGVFFLGLFFSWSFNKILLIAKNYPTLILWIPSIYVLVVVVETDILTIFNAFTKSVFLVWLMYKFSNTFFRVKF